MVGKQVLCIIHRICLDGEACEAQLLLLAIIKPSVVKPFSTLIGIVI